MTLEEFLEYIRTKTTMPGSDAYWTKRYNSLKDKSREFILNEIPFMAIRAIGDNYEELYQEKTGRFIDQTI